MKTQSLSGTWQVRQRERSRDLAEDLAASDGWIPARVPGTAHEALLAAKLIPDPFYGLNEQSLQWIGERDWLFRCVFDVDPSLIAEGFPALCFDGLDTVATVWLNGVQILQCDNMFVPQRVSVDTLLQPGTNILVILFASALHYGKKIESELGKLAAWNGDASRVYVRKAQYHYGWDWGPCLLTAGPWRAVRLEAGALRLADVHCPAEVAADLASATLPVYFTIPVEPSTLSGYSTRVQLYGPDGVLLEQVEAVTAEHGSHTFVVQNPALWWPHGHGDQPLYRLRVELLRGDEVVDSQEMRIGLRRLCLVQEPLEADPGTSFLFEINNRPIFCGGANWIPADSFTTRLTAQDYRLQLQQAADAHMVMLRIWGGGIYEEDVFYDLCDELGLMVWQDFMFACGIYPAHPPFQASIRAEAEAQVRRLRHHCSLVLWCGNNEDYQIAESLHAYDIDFNGDFTTTAFPGRELYERLLPTVCADLDPTRPYWPSSPYGGPSVADQTRGDRHTWDIWHGAVAPYSAYPKYEGRFVSEFGLEAAPSLPLLLSVVPEGDRYPQSRTMDHHNKSTDGARRLAIYLNDTLRTKDTLEDYVYATQFVQAEALRVAYSGWRRRWKGPNNYAVAGALVWQLDDCWPVTSWAIVDYARRPKPSYYVIRRELAPISVGLSREGDSVSAWAVSDAPQDTGVTLDVRGFAFDGTQVFSTKRDVVLGPNRATELGSFPVSQDIPVVVGARLWVGHKIVARTVSWPEPFKYFILPEPEISMVGIPGGMLLLKAARPAKGVWLNAEGALAWSDNMLDLLPDDPQQIHVSGLGEGSLTVQWLRSS